MDAVKEAEAILRTGRGGPGEPPVEDDGRREPGRDPEAVIIRGPRLVLLIFLVGWLLGKLSR